MQFASAFVGQALELGILRSMTARYAQKERENREGEGERKMGHVIIGTAGHIDHGKTALIKALTGRDTDRLRRKTAGNYH